KSGQSAKSGKDSASTAQKSETPSETKNEAPSQSVVKKSAAALEKPIERPAALQRAANAPVGKVGAPSTPGAEPADKEKETKPRKVRRVSSSGTITPGAGTSGAIMSFPAE
ncbi:MAG: hypothetical protein ACTHZP_05335, partial [Ancrocorticia populi]